MVKFTELRFSKQVPDKLKKEIAKSPFLIEDNLYIYYAGSTTRTIVKLLKSNMTTAVSSPNYGGTIYCVTQDDLYIYYGGEITQTIVKLLKSNMSVVATSPNYGGAIYWIGEENKPGYRTIYV